MSNNSRNIVLVRKASGELEPFAAEKLERSLFNAGAGEELTARIIDDITLWLSEGTTTKQIYSRAFKILKRQQRQSSLRYRLKQAILELGPAGYPFEHFAGEIFFRRGFKVEVGVVVEGGCVSHEMDVIATGNGEQHLAECKYSQDPGRRVGVQVPLYVRSRVDDIIRRREKLEQYRGLSFKGWVITNMRFSSDSIQYGSCSGLNLLAWDYPQSRGLKDIIEQQRIYPVTVLDSLTKQLKHELLQRGIVSCRQLGENLDLLKELLGLAGPGIGTETGTGTGLGSRPASTGANIKTQQRRLKATINEIKVLGIKLN